MKELIKALSLLMALIASNQAFASLITYSSFSELQESTSALIIEDWRGYERNTVLSNQTINGITYQPENSLGEPIVTLGNYCRYGEYWCISHLTESGGTRSFGWAAVRFQFQDPIDAFSISLVQGINDRIDGTSIWDVSFDTGQSVRVVSNYTIDDSYGLGYLGISGIHSASEVIVRKIWSDSNVVYSFNHIGYQNIQVDEPSTFLILAIALMLTRRFRRHQ